MNRWTTCTHVGLEKSDHCRHFYNFSNLFSTLEHMFWAHPFVSSHPQKVSVPVLLLISLLTHVLVWKGQITVATSITLQICSLQWNTCFETIHVCLATRKKFLSLISSSFSPSDTYPRLETSDHCRHFYNFPNMLSALEHMFWDHPFVSSHPQKVSGPTLVLVPVLTCVMGWRDQITIATSIS